MNILHNIWTDVFGHNEQMNYNWSEFQRRISTSNIILSSSKRAQKNPEFCCKGLVALMIPDPNSPGNYIPKRCSRAPLQGTDYCKTHGKNTSHNICQECTEHHGQDTYHTFLHEHFGIVGKPSFHFDKFKLKMIQNNLNQQTKKEKKNYKDHDTTDSTNNQNHKNKKIKKNKKNHERKITPNAFMSWLMAHRAQIKADIHTNNPQMSPRELMVSTTKKAGELWKLLSKTEQDKWKSTTNQPQITNTNTNDNDILQVIPTQQHDDDDQDHNNDSQINSNVITTDEIRSDETASTLPLDDDDDDDSVQLTFNQTHQVWVEEDTGLYYKENNPDQAPMGQIVAGKLVPFKKNNKRAAAAPSY